MTQYERIQSVAKDIRPLIQKFDSRNFIVDEDIYYRKLIRDIRPSDLGNYVRFTDRDLNRVFTLKRSDVSISLYIAGYITNSAYVSFETNSDARSFLNTIILSNPKKYYIK